MEWLLGAFIFLVGLVTSVRWLARGGVPVEQYVKRDLAKHFEDEARSYSGEARQVYDEVVAYLRGEPVGAPHPEPIIIEPGSHSEPAHHNVSHSASRVLEPEKEPPAKGWATTDMSEAFKSMDNITLLLYLGAFLVVVSASIFVGYNYSELSGAFKTFFVAVFALMFYSLGLMLHAWSTKFRPAGTTFTAVGIILTPLVGLAAYNFIWHDAGSWVWLVTSLVSLGLYFLAFVRLRQTYMTYLTAFMAVSLFESSVSVVKLPTYYLAWGLALVSLIMALLSHLRRSGVWEDFQEPVWVSANIFLPASVLVSLSMVADLGASQAGITLLLASAYYAIVSFIPAKQKDQEIYFGLGTALAPFGLLLALSSLEAATLGLVLVGLGTVMTLSGGLLRHMWRDMRPNILVVVGGLSVLAATFFALDDFGLCTGILAAAVLVNAYAFWRLRQAASLLLAVLALLFLPFSALQFWLDPAAPAWVTSLVYLGIAGLLIQVRYFVGHWAHEIRGVAIFGYAVAMLASFGWSLGAGDVAGIWLALLLAGAAFGVSFMEHQPLIIVAMAGFAYAAAVRLGSLGQAEFGAYSWSLLVTGLVFYAGSWFLEGERRRVMAYCGLAGPYLGAIAGLTDDALVGLPQFALLVGGGLTFYQSWRERTASAQYVSAAVMLLAVQWWMGASGVTETQVYTIGWAIYFGVLAYIFHRRDKPSDRDSLTALSLGFLTLPLAFQSFGDNGAFYGLALVFESLALVMVGIAAHYRLVTYWGAAALVTEVLYQMREVLFAIPKYLITAALGLGLLVFAIVLLSRRKE